MLAQRQSNARFTIIDETKGQFVCTDAQFGWALKVLQDRGYSKSDALAVVATKVADWEWKPAYRRAMDRLIQGRESA